MTIYYSLHCDNCGESPGWINQIRKAAVRAEAHRKHGWRFRKAPAGKVPGNDWFEDLCGDCRDKGWLHDTTNSRRSAA